jgi:hypothetical protein
MKKIKDKMINIGCRYTKVTFDNKNFRRFQYVSQGRTNDILWLSNEREFLPDKLEQRLEKEFKKVG